MVLGSHFQDQTVLVSHINCEIAVARLLKVRLWLTRENCEPRQGIM